MTVEELIKELNRYPSNYTVEALQVKRNTVQNGRVTGVVRALYKEATIRIVTN